MAEKQEIRLSFGEEISPERRKSSFGLVTIRAHAAPETVISIAVPTDWKEISNQPAPVGSRPGWEELASFAPSNNASFHVFQVAQPYEVPLTDWLAYQASLLSIKLVAEERGENEFGQMVHALGSAPQGDRVRIALAGDGPNLFLLMGRCSRTEPPDMDAILGLIAGSFLFPQHSKRKTREKLILYQGGRNTFRMLYPESWMAESRPGQPGGRIVVDFRISGGNDTLAYIRITSDAQPARNPVELKTAFETTMKEVSEAGISVEEIEAIPAGPGGGERERWLGTCRLPSGRGQIALLFRPAPFGWLSAVMLAPEKSRNPIVWMRAKRFYEILTASLSSSRTN